MNARLHRVSPCRAFSLLEIVMVLALIALLAGLTAANMESLFGAGDARPAVEVFRVATHEARLRAINHAQPVYLTYDAEGRRFVLTSPGETAPTSVDERKDDEFTDDGEPPEGASPASNYTLVEPTEFPVLEDELEVEFRGLRAEQSGPGFSRDDWTSDPLPRLVFHPSGVSTPAVAVLRASDGEEQVLTMDLFSNGPQLNREDGVF